MYQKIRLLFLLTCLVFVFFSHVCAQSESVAKPFIQQGTIVAKVKPGFRNSCKSKAIDQLAVNQVLIAMKADAIGKMFPFHAPPANKFNSAGFQLIDLSLIYEVHYTAEITLEKALAMLRNTGYFEYVEPKYLPIPLYLPNDPKIGNEYFLSKISAFQAWELEQGDSTVVIGIVDTGTDDDHEDLVGNLKYNYDDPIDGIDNDNDTYVDNYRGWDLGEKDNDPQVAPGGGNSSHGALICGIAAASTDNLIGVAGVGFKCKFLPVKVANADGQFTKAFEGIVYAADHNCTVINCSWGSPYAAGQFGQDIVNYATFNKNALVIAAAGNEGTDIPYYPASYQNVLSVAATDANDEKMFIYPGYASSYGHFIDVCAPGWNILSTWDFPYFYKSLSGTSMACAVVSGAAAIVKSHFPQYDALQIAEKLRVTCDSIDQLPANIPYSTKLGMGRINLFRALSNNNSSSVRLKRVEYHVTNGQEPGPGDTVSMKAVFFNYLSQANGLSIKISSSSPYITILDSVFNPGVLQPSDSVNNFNIPFVFVVNPNVPPTETSFIKLTYTDNTHTSFEFAALELAPDYLTISNGKLATTLTSKGRIGYNDDYNCQGTGFRYNSWDSYLSAAGFILGSSYTKVSDAVMNETHTGYDHDFKTLNKIKILSNPELADVETLTIFNDSLAGFSAIGTEITQKTYSWNDEADKKYIICEYKIKNTGSAAVNFLYGGLYCDWDITSFTAAYNRVSWDSATRMGYTCSIDGWPMVGLSLISDGPVKHYAFDLNGANSSIKVSDGFTANEKYLALKSNRHQAGLQTSGNDVADMVSSGPFLLQPADTLTLAFALIGGDYLDDLRNSAIRAKLRYKNQLTLPELTGKQQFEASLLPNPFSNHSELNLTINNPGFIHIDITDLQGRLVKKVFSGNLSAGTQNFPVSLANKGIFFLNIRTASGVKVLKIVNV